MAVLSANDIDAIVKSVASKLSEGQSFINSTKNVNSHIAVAGTFATDDSIRAACADASTCTVTIVFDPLGRIFPSASRVVANAIDAIVSGASCLSLTGLSLFELEALSDPKQGNPIAELVVEAIGRGWRVSLSNDVIESGNKAARLSLLRGALAARRDAAFMALAAMGIEKVTCTARSGSLGASNQKAVRLIDSALVSSTAPGATIVAGFGAIITPLASDEARDRGIRIERNGTAI